MAVADRNQNRAIYSKRQLDAKDMFHHIVPSWFCKNTVIFGEELCGACLSKDFGDLKMEGIVSLPKLGFVCVLFVREGAVGWEAKEKKPKLTRRHQTVQRCFVFVAFREREREALCNMFDMFV